MAPIYSSMNPFKYIKNNPKKSVFGALVCGYIGNWIYQLHENHLFRHAVCRQILKLGSDHVNWYHQTKTITVFLNPAANNGKATKLFEKNAVPILHLSGCNVKVIRLDYEGQAKQLMSVLDDTDIIVAAGGNGTLNEVITGLLRRQDFEKWAHVPVGVIPLGENNTVCNQLNKYSDTNSKEQSIMKATTDIVKNNSKPIDVMKITGEGGKSVFAISDIRWGSYSDAFGRTSKYWFWGPLKKYMTFVFASYKKNIKVPRELELAYNDPLPIIEHENKSQNNIAVNHGTFSLISSLLNPIISRGLSLFGKSINEEPAKCSSADKSEETNLNKMKFKGVLQLKTLELTASINTHQTDQRRDQVSAGISIEKDDFSMLDFISNGPKRFSHERPQPVNLQSEIKAGSFKVLPVDVEDSWFKIDNESFEAMPCAVEVLPNKIRIICSSPL